MDSDYPGHRPVAAGECGYLLGGDIPGICRKRQGHFFPPPEGDGSACESDGHGLPSQRGDMPDEMVLPGLPEDGGTEQVTVFTPDGAHQAEVHTVRLGLAPYILMTMERVDEDGLPMFHIEFGGGLDALQAQDVIRSLAASMSEGGDDVQPGDPGGAETALPGAAGAHRNEGG